MLGPCVHDIWSQLLWPCSSGLECEVSNVGQAKPQVPIVMLADGLELSDGALKSVDAIVTKADGAHFLWATVHFILNVKPNPREQATLSGQAPIRHRRTEQCAGRTS